MKGDYTLFISAFQLLFYEFNNTFWNLFVSKSETEGEKREEREPKNTGSEKGKCQDPLPPP